MGRKDNQKRKESESMLALQRHGFSFIKLCNLLILQNILVHSKQFKYHRTC